MKRLVLIFALLLYAAPLWADCLELPIIGNGKDVDERKLTDRIGAYRPQIPAGVPQDYTTDGIPTVGGKPKFSTVITCFRDSVKIPPRLGPMTRDQAAMFIHDRDATTRFNPDALKMLEPRSSLEQFLDRAWWMASRYVGAVAAFAGTGTDNFNRADSADLGANWDPYDNPASAPCQIVGNVVGNSTGGQDCTEGFSAYIPTANQYVQIALPSGFLTDGFQFATAIVRLQAPPTYSGYYCRAQPPSQVNTSRIRRVDAGSNATLANDTTQTWAAADVLRCEITGTSINLKRNGVTIVSASTSGEYTSGRGGINSLDDPAGFNNPIDDFEVGDLGGTTVVRHRPLVIQ